MRFRFRDFENRDEMTKREREILKKSKVMWEEGTVECAWERERKTCVSGEDSGDKPFKKIIYILRAKLGE